MGGIPPQKKHLIIIYSRGKPTYHLAVSAVLSVFTGANAHTVLSIVNLTRRILFLLYFTYLYNIVLTKLLLFTSYVVPIRIQFL